MGNLVLSNALLVGVFAFAMAHYGIQWWLSRNEHVLLLFSIQCALYAGFSCLMVCQLQAKTIPDAQAALDKLVTLGVIAHAIVVQFYAHLSARRDRSFRWLLTGVLGFLVVQHQWLPLRGIVIELQPMQLPGGGMGRLAIRTPPGVGLTVLYLAVLAIYAYGWVVARRVWKRDRPSGAFVALGSTAVGVGALIGFLVDFAHLRAPYVGAAPHAIFLLCMSIVFSREYAARGARLEALVATRTLELSKAKDEAERANRAKSEFIAHVSHEIGNPLAALLLYARLLQNDRSLDEKQRQRVDAIHLSGRHLSTLLENVIDMSKIEAGRLELKEKPFCLNAVLDDLGVMFAAHAAASGIDFAIDRPSELRRSLLGDVQKLKQILINLVINAFKFTDKGSIRITASTRALSGGTVLIQIAVADTGVGIAKQDAARLFEPFEQLTAGARGGGAGLGLAISLAYARKMRGDLTVQSTPGVGSTFTLTVVTRGTEDPRNVQTAAKNLAPAVEPSTVSSSRA